jgi:hypothetical protein
MKESKKISNKNLRLSQDEKIKKLKNECTLKVKENDEVSSIFISFYYCKFPLIIERI